MSILVSVTEV